MCLVGANLGCKTNLVRNHVLESFPDVYISTVGAKVSKRVVRLRKPATGPATIDLVIWDILSDRDVRALLQDALFHGSRGILAVTDMTRRKTLEELDEWITAVQRIAGPIPVAVVAANRGRGAKPEVSDREVAAVARDHNAPCFFESGDLGDPVEAAFHYLADTVLRSLTDAPVPRGKTEG